jgi:hypothetical protein
MKRNEKVPDTAEAKAARGSASNGATPPLNATA